VNYATNPAAFDRSQAHTIPYSTVSEASFEPPTAYCSTGLTPNSTYYFEVVAETAEGLWIASDPSSSIQEKRTTLPLRTSTTFRCNSLARACFIKWRRTSRAIAG